MAKDPVCGMEVDDKRAAATSIYKEDTYYFCAKGCKIAFDLALHGAVSFLCGGSLVRCPGRLGIRGARIRRHPVGLQYFL